MSFASKTVLSLAFNSACKDLGYIQYVLSEVSLAPLLGYSLDGLYGVSLWSSETIRSRSTPDRPRSLRVLIQVV